MRKILQIFFLLMIFPACAFASVDDYMFFRMIESGDVEGVKAVIAEGQTLNAKNEKQETPIFLAVKHGIPEIVEILIKASADIYLRDYTGKTPLHYAVAVPLLSRNKNAPINKYLKNIELLLDAGAIVDAQDDEGNTPLILLATLSGESEKNFEKELEPLFSILINAGADLNARDSDKGTALIRAASGENTNIPLLLINAGADVNAKNVDGITALAMASVKGSSYVVENLIKKGADVNIYAEGLTPLHTATGFGLVTITRKNVQESFGEILERNGVSDVNFLEITKLLVDAGADVNALSIGQNSLGESLPQLTPLDFANAVGNTKVAEYLKSVGGKANEKIMSAFLAYLVSLADLVGSHYGHTAGDSENMSLSNLLARFVSLLVLIFLVWTLFKIIRRW